MLVVGWVNLRFHVFHSDERVGVTLHEEIVFFDIILKHVDPGAPRLLPDVSLDA